MENGANLEEIAHEYLHTLPREKEEEANDMLREFKRQKDIELGFVVINGTEVGKVQLENVQVTEEYIVIPAYDVKKSKYNRAKVKREYQKIIDEDLEYEEWEREV